MTQRLSPEIRADALEDPALHLATWEGHRGWRSASKVHLSFFDGIPDEQVFTARLHDCRSISGEDDASVAAPMRRFVLSFNCPLEVAF